MAAREIRLGDIADLSAGGTPSRAVPEFFGGKIPWMKTLDLTNGWVTASEEAITKLGLQAFRGAIYPVGTVVVAMYGGSGTIGKSGILGVPAAINQALCALPPRPDIWDSEYLNHWLQYVRPQWMRFSAGNRKDPNINKRVVANMILRLPPLQEQQRIRKKLVSALTAANDCIANCRGQMDDAGRFAGALLEEQFPNSHPIQTGSGEEAMSWRWHRLLDLARLESGHTPSRRRPEWWGGTVPWLSLTDIRKLHGKYVYETGEYTNDAGLANSSARLLPPSTVCLSRTASVGFVTILGKPMSTSQDFCNWICDPEKLDPDFLMYAFMASQDYLCELGSGAVHKTIYMPTIKSFHVCAPDITEQQRIGRTLRERLAAAEALSEGLKARLAEIERLPQRLLAAAFGYTG